jgi:predicted ATPase with chaperone activity
MIGSSNQFPPGGPCPDGKPSSVPQSNVEPSGLPSLGSTPGMTSPGVQPGGVPLPGAMLPSAMPPGAVPLSGAPGIPGPPINSGPLAVPGGPVGTDRGYPLAGHGPPAVPGQGQSPGVSGAEQPGFRSYSQQAELYAELFGVAPTLRLGNGADKKAPNRLNQVQAPPPTSPKSLKESGITLSQVCDLVLKQLYLHGSLLGVEIARNARLPFNVIDECLRFLKDEHAIQVTSGEVIGRVSYRFHLTELGRSRAKEAFEFCRYVGPAPVPLETYVEQCRRQAVAGINCTAEALLEGFSELIIPPHLIEELGPAVCTGRSIFLYGPPGNGKSQIAKGLGRFLNHHGGDIYVPYAIQSENSIITVFDPSLHQTTDDDELRTMLGESPGQKQGSSKDVSRLFHEDHPDLRWRRVRRPVVVTGGELTLDMLDLRFNQASNFYVAPLQMKANGGVFMIDDFGRQIVKPRDLLNRWILPLEERIDYVTLATGKKFPVPFEELIIFSTNLDPADLVDDAFLRRIRHKIKIDTPNRELFTEIFSLVCELNQVPFEPRAVEYLYANYYGAGQLPRSSDPRDLLEIVQSICRFRNQRFVLTQDLMSEATQRFFTKL